MPVQWRIAAATEASRDSSEKAYDVVRAALMVRNNEGVTKTCNRFHDPEEPSPDILKLRDLHTAMDRAVLDAYGWTDIPNACEFLLDYEEDEEEGSAADTGKGRKKRKPCRYRWPDAVRDEVLAKLLALNAERAEEDQMSGAKVSTKKPSTSSKRESKSETKVEQQRSRSQDLPYEAGDSK